MCVQRATWAGHITQSEQVYSALESEVVMFRLFVLCTFRFRKKYSKMSKKWTVQPKPVQKSYSYIPDLMERIFLKRLWTLGHISQHVKACQQMTSDEFPVQSQKFQPHLRNLLHREWKGCKSQYDALFFCFVLWNTTRFGSLGLNDIYWTDVMLVLFARFHILQ